MFYGNMSVRGINFEHLSGDYVLCFEPDSTKARVLYDAKILELSVGRDSKGKRKPAYLVHFQGWNDSWDRIVPESLVLKNSDENRELKRTIGRIAKKIRKNSVRKRKIEHILRRTLPKKRNLNVHSFDSDSSGDEVSDEIDVGNLGEAGADDSMTESERDRDNSDEDSGSDRSDVESEELEENGVEEMEEDEEEEMEPREVHIELHANLKRKLEDDCYFIQRKKKMIKLPAEPNIISILEGYVKNFGTNLVYAENKHYPSRGDRDRPPPPEKNIDLCKEVIDGLRIMFDFTLSTKLLYDAERAYFEKMTHSLYKHRPTARSISVRIKREPVDSYERPRARLRSASTSKSHPQISSPKPDTRASHSYAELNYTENDTVNEPPSRRLTRHAHALGTSHVSKKPGIKTEPVTTEKESIEQKGTRGGRVRRGCLRSRAHKSLDDEGSGNALDSGPESVGNIYTCENKTPSVNGGSHRSSSNTANHTSESSLPSLVYQHGYRSKEAALNDIFAWKLVPEDLCSQSPVQPSLICGAHHFARLFVRLPEVLSEMNIPDKHFEPLMTHVNMLVEYISNSCDELMTESAYIDV